MGHGSRWFSTSFGTEVAGAGDVNGDGYDDLLVGASGYHGIDYYNVGRAFPYQGGCYDQEDIDLDAVGDACDACTSSIRTARAPSVVVGPIGSAVWPQPLLAIVVGPRDDRRRPDDCGRSGAR